MSVETPSPRRPPRPGSEAKLVHYDEYIDRQIRTTRRLVKMVDFATALVLLAIGVLGFLFAAALVEHWVVPSGFPVPVRAVLFALLVSGTGYFAYRRLWPLCARAINPVYAAHAIEEGHPSLKNSLINLLLFRERRAEISEPVYKTLEEQAAQRLTRVPVDSAVDRAPLIRMGYVLLAVVAVAALYKVVSPKDPLVAAERVLLPWADIVPASRTLITEVEPGAATIPRGEFLTVSAEVRGIGENDDVVLRYTTSDGQAVNKPISMTAEPGGSRFIARMPNNADGSGSAGIAQNLTYRIEAGDARTLDFPVTVVTAPTILVERIEYDYPAYTGYVDRVEEAAPAPGTPANAWTNPGHIRALEGTRVTLHARANSPIDEAYVDFDADGRRDLRMSADGTNAHVQFELGLREDRQTPKYLSYVLRFVTRDGRDNRNPVKHPIEVLPDLAPEIKIVKPQEESLVLGLHDTLVIEVEAIDPDFGLAQVRLHGEATARTPVNVKLVEAKHTGRFVGRFRFVPSQHNLRPGDIVKYWAEADDVRAPKPNSAATDKHTIRIASPDPNDPPPDRIAQRDQRQQPGGRQQEQQQQGNEGQQGAEGQQGKGQQNGQGQQGAEGQPGAQGEQQNGNQQGQPNAPPGAQGGRPGENQQPQQSNEPGERGGQPQPGNELAQNNRQQGREGEQQRGSAERQPQTQNSRGGESSSAGGQQQKNDASGQRGGQQQSKPEQTGAESAGGGSPQQGSQPAGARQPEKGADQQANPQESSPVSSDGDDDGTAFDRIRNHLRQKGEVPEDAKDDSAGESASAEGEQPSNQGESASADGNREQPGNTPQSQNQARGPANRANDNKARAEDQSDGPGAETRQDDLQQSEDQQPGESNEQTESPGGQQTTSKGAPGAGEQPQKNQGAPDSQPGMKPTNNKQQSPADRNKMDDQEPPSTGQGKRETDSRGEQGGDQAGGGEEGGGQRAPREGTGSAGQNQAADEGAGQSTEKGAGQESPNAGQDAKSDHQTGEPGSNEKGPGSSQREGQGNQPGGKPGTASDQQARQQNQNGEQSGGNKQQNGQQNQPAANDSKQQPGSDPQRNPDSAAKDGGDRSDSDASRDGRGAATGSGGDTGAAAGPPPRSEGTAPEGDAANLEYARKQTDLVLDRLADQLKRRQVDKDMLKRLGWSEDDLRAFVDRWQQRKEAARRGDAESDAAQRELDDALRSLGLRRGTLRQNQAADDSQRDLRQGFRGPVPTQYQDRLRAYNQGVSRAQQDQDE